MRKIVKSGEAHGQKPAQRAKRPLPFAGANAARFVRWAQQKVEPEIRLKRGPVLAMAGMPLWNASTAETRLFGSAAAGMDAPHGELLQSITVPAR